MADWLHGTWAVFEKDVRLEFRNRYAVNTLIMFVLASMPLVLFAMGQENIGIREQSALLWLIILFAGAVGLGRSFISEEERGTVLILQLNTRPSMVYAGKLLFNFLLIFSVNLVALVAFIIFLQLTVEIWGLLLLTLALGAIGLAGATTLLAALIARSSSQGAVLPVLLFPLLIPLLVSVVHATQSALIEHLGWDAALNDLMVLIGYAGVTITASVLLFDYVWND
ncbi:MAG: heme exporter protein CcmB [Rhodothermales bacterium]